MIDGGFKVQPMKLTTAQLAFILVAVLALGGGAGYAIGRNTDKKVTVEWSIPAGENEVVSLRNELAATRSNALKNSNDLKVEQLKILEELAAAQDEIKTLKKQTP